MLRRTWPEVISRKSAALARNRKTVNDLVVESGSDSRIAAPMASRTCSMGGAYTEYSRINEHCDVSRNQRTKLPVRNYDASRREIYAHASSALASLEGEPQENSATLRVFGGNGLREGRVHSRIATIDSSRPEISRLADIRMMSFFLIDLMRSAATERVRSASAACAAMLPRSAAMYFASS